MTAVNLSEFWLDEGIVTFMVAAWKEHRWSREAYDREIALARRRWQAKLDRRGDVPLAYDGLYASVGTRFSIQCSKGAVFLHELRETMSGEAFWTGLAQFTREGFGTAVTSRDFERAMQAQTGIPLGPMFASWVHEGRRYGSASESQSSAAASCAGVGFSSVPLSLANGMNLIVQQDSRST